jgi:hypothetical protein
MSAGRLVSGRRYIVRRRRRLPLVAAALAVTAGTLVLGQRARKTRLGRRRIEATTPERGGRGASRPRAVSLETLPQAAEGAAAQPEGNLRVAVRREELPGEPQRVAFVVVGRPPRVRPREVRNGRFGRPRGPQARS